MKKYIGLLIAVLSTLCAILVYEIRDLSSAIYDAAFYEVVNTRSLLNEESEIDGDTVDLPGPPGLFDGPVMYILIGFVLLGIYIYYTRRDK